jgi:protein KTI12
MVRWDSPLFTLPWNEEETPVEEIWQAVTAGVLKPPNAGTSSVRTSDQHRPFFRAKD